MWWWREPLGHVPYPLHEEATGTSHLIAGPGSRGDRFLAFLWTIKNKRGDWAGHVGVPLGTILRWGGDGSFLPRNIHPQPPNSENRFRIYSFFTKGRTQGTWSCLQVTLIQFISLCVFNVLSWLERGKKNRKLNGEWLGWEKGLGWGRGVLRGKLFGHKSQFLLLPNSDDSLQHHSGERPHVDTWHGCWITLTRWEKAEELCLFHL